MARELKIFFKEIEPSSEMLKFRGTQIDFQFFVYAHINKLNRNKATSIPSCFSGLKFHEKN